MTIFNYTVNYIDVALVLFVLIITVIGYFRGVISSVVRFIRASLGLFLCFYLSSYYTQPLYNSVVRPRLLNTINEKIVISGNIDEIITNLYNYIASLPKFVVSSINVKSLNITSDDISLAILENVFEPAAIALTKAAIFISVFLIFFISTEIIILIVRKIIKKKNEKRGKESALKKADRIFGVVLGLMKSVVIVLAITSVLMYFIQTKENLAASNSFWREVNNSSLLNIINGINPFNAVTEGLL